MDPTLCYLNVQTLGEQPLRAPQRQSLDGGSSVTWPSRLQAGIELSCDRQPRRDGTRELLDSSHGTFGNALGEHDEERQKNKNQEDEADYDKCMPNRTYLHQQRGNLSQYQSAFR